MVSDPEQLSINNIATLTQILDTKLAHAMEEVKRQASHELLQSGMIINHLAAKKKSEKKDKDLRKRFPILSGAHNFQTMYGGTYGTSGLHSAAVGGWALRREIAITRDYFAQKEAIGRGQMDEVTLLAWKLGGESDAMPRLEESVQPSGPVQGVLPYSPSGGFRMT